MEPLEYLRVFRRRWRLLVSCVLVAGVAAWVTTPATPSLDAAEYEASHTIIRDTSASGDTPTQSLATVNLLVKTGDVPRRAAERLGYEGNPLRLARSVVTEVDEQVGTLTITATAGTRDDAAEVANVFAEETLGHLGEQVQDDLDDDIDAIEGQLAQLRVDIDALEAQIAAAEAADQDTALLQTQRDARLRQYGAALDQQTALLNQPPPAAGYVTLEPASGDLATVKGSGFDAPRSRPVRAVIGAMLGLLLGLAMVLVVERLDPRLKTRAETERAFGLPVVAEVPWNHEVRRDPYRIVSLDQPAGSHAEAYRSLRAALLLMPRHVLRDDAHEEPLLVESEPRVVLVTSAAPNEGKTSTVANLAVAFAEIGRSVLVLGCDFRRPEVHNYFGVVEAPGLSDLLENRHGVHDLGAITKLANVPNVRVVPNGSPLHNFGDVAAFGREMVAQARSWADVVLVDTAPLLATNDAIELLPSVDAVVIVSRTGRTTVESARRAREMLGRLGAPVTGICSIGTPPQDASYRAYYYTDAPPARHRWLRLRRRVPEPTPAMTGARRAGSTNGNGSRVRSTPKKRARQRSGR
jgi:polysaccharide biosynthesis transport protein